MPIDLPTIIIMFALGFVFQFGFIFWWLIRDNVKDKNDEAGHKSEH